MADESDSLLFVNFLAGNRPNARQCREFKERVDALNDFDEKFRRRFRLSKSTVLKLLAEVLAFSCHITVLKLLAEVLAFSCHIIFFYCQW